MQGKTLQDFVIDKIDDLKGQDILPLDPPITGPGIHSLSIIEIRFLINLPSIIKKQASDMVATIFKLRVKIPLT